MSPPNAVQPSKPGAGAARLEFRRQSDSGRGPGRTGLAGAFARSPLRILTPRNHGEASWVFLASLGGGLLDGDRLEVEVDVAAGAAALLGTQASTKVYRSPPGGAGASQHLRARVGEGALLAAVPDPVVCFADARYEQTIAVDLAPSASVLLLDGYTCGRSARGERWAFARYASRTSVTRGGARIVVDAVRLDPAEGALAERMGAFDAVLTLIALGPRFASVRQAMVEAQKGQKGVGDVGELVVAASPLDGGAGSVLRVAAPRFETASRVLRSSFAELARVLGDDPFARKW